jgi:hypothetical protein
MCSLCWGIKAAAEDSKYILCLDDDAQMHGAMLKDMVLSLEQDPLMFVATGYPFDVPRHRNASIFAYAVLSFHLLCIIPFSFPRVSNVWGGCMLYRRSDLQEDRQGLVQVLHLHALTLAASTGSATVLAADATACVTACRHGRREATQTT